MGKILLLERKISCLIYRKNDLFVFDKFLNYYDGDIELIILNGMIYFVVFR